MQSRRDLRSRLARILSSALGREPDRYDEDVRQLRLSSTTDERLGIAAQSFDFAPYVSAVAASAQRTRNAIFLLAVALVTIFVTFRSTISPAWADARLTAFESAKICMDRGTSSTYCTQNIEYTSSFLFGDLKPTKTELRTEIKTQIDELMRRRIDTLSMNLPVFGVAIDARDMGIFSAVTFVLVLALVTLTMSSELGAQRTAKLRAIQTGNTRNLEQLMLGQVFTARAYKSNLGLAAFCAFFSLPVILQTSVFLEDLYVKPQYTVLLEGSRPYTITMVIELACYLGIWLLAIECCITSRKYLDHLRGVAKLAAANIERMSHAAIRGGSPEAHQAEPEAPELGEGGLPSLPSSPI